MNYIESQFNGFNPEKQGEYKYTLQINGIGHKTKCISISEDQLEAIKEILLKSDEK